MRLFVNSVVDTSTNKIFSLIYRAITSTNIFPIFTFHHVLPKKDPISPNAIDAESFDDLCYFLSICFNVISLGDALSLHLMGKLPPKTAVITFDDGFLNNYTVALPILKKHRLTATFFLTTGFINNGWMWNSGIYHAVSKTKKRVLDFSSIGLGRLSVLTVNEKRSAIQKILKRLKYIQNNKRYESVKKMFELAEVDEPSGVMMNALQIKRLSDSGMDIGGHTVTHPILNNLTTREARREIESNKRELEAIIGKRLGYFAYPNGRPGKDYDATHINIVRKIGFKGAVSTHPRLVSHPVDYFQVNRYTPWDRNIHKFHLRLIQHGLIQRVKEKFKIHSS